MHMTLSSSQPTHLRVCIVTADFPGLIKNGGIGTAYLNLARLLVEGGHDVTVLYSLGCYSEADPIDYWQREYMKERIKLIPLPPWQGIELKGSNAVRTSYRVYEWIKHKRFDIVHAHEWRGIGFYTALAKAQGLCLMKSVLCVGAHSPTLWHREGMNEPWADLDELEISHMERTTVERADILWSPSRHMIEWISEHGWKVPAVVEIRPNVLQMPAKDCNRKRSRREVNEVVFFGRIETRKGVELFCHAVDQLLASRTRPFKVTFLGKLGRVGLLGAEEYLARRTAAWRSGGQVLSSFGRDAALEYLSRDGRLAVIPSTLDNSPYTVLECLAQNVPFVASRVGGVPELIHSCEHDRVLFDFKTESLSQQLQRAIEDGGLPARASFDIAENNFQWKLWHEEMRSLFPRVPRRGSPMVSVCLTHHERPRTLARALRSLIKQDYRNFEVVLVDDGSRSPKALRYLERIERVFNRRGWKLIRQPNRYLGAARNTAARAACGRYLLFMDDDNIAKPSEVSTLVRAAEASHADILTCFLDVFRGSGDPSPVNQQYRYPFLGGDITLGLAANIFGDANALWRREGLESLGGFTEDFGIGCEDWELFSRAVLHGLRLEVVPEALVWYRQSGTGMLSTTSAAANERRAFRAYSELLPNDLQGIARLAKQLILKARSADLSNNSVPCLDAVRSVAIFGAGEGGRLAAELAEQCGWQVGYFVDNNQALWDSLVHGRIVLSPQALLNRDFDRVIVASMAGKETLFNQLRSMGFEYGDHFIHFNEPFSLRRLRCQLHF
jgi:O-antigen biosynthesis protein